MNSKIFHNNRISALFLGLLVTMSWWYLMLMMTQKKVVIKKRHYIALGFALLAYCIWFFKFSYLVKSN